MLCKLNQSSENLRSYESAEKTRFLAHLYVSHSTMETGVLG